VHPQPSAREAFSLTVIDPPRRRIWLAALFNLIGQSTGTDDGGGRRAVIRRRDTEEVLGEFAEPFVGASSSEYTVVLSDYSTMNAEDFERAWLCR
jgi:hypothetical protein